ncbi:hypothetical protein FHX03_000262 [Rhizobium sp. BK456]|nr:hypothetical protein [Rhizobium sp. BK456]
MTDVVNIKPFVDMLEEAERNRELYLAERAWQLEEDEREAVEYESYLASKGMLGPYPDPDTQSFVSALDREVDRIMIEFESLVSRQIRDQDDAIEALNDIRRALNLESEGPPVPVAKQLRDVDPHEPLTIIEAVCLPELGGRLFSDGTAIPSKTVTVYAVRTAIAEGRLQLHPASRRGSHRISRTLIKEWMAWQDVANPLGSSSKQSARTRTVAPKPQSGSSNIMTREREKQLSSARDLALAKLKQRKNTSPNG